MIQWGGRPWQLAQNLGLLAICLTCYTLLIILYVSPRSYHLESLVYPDRGTIRPTVAVGLITATLTGATSALMTRCVEHSLWITLARGPNTALTVAEARRLAQWSTSPLQRIWYPIGGVSGAAKRSWTLRLAGPLLVASVIVGPILLGGISQFNQVDAIISSEPHTADPWQSRFDLGNVRYRGGNSYDNPTAIAALAAMRNLSAPVAPICDDILATSLPDRPVTCVVTARTVAIRADCESSSMENPDGVGLTGSRNDTYEFCTGQGTPVTLCVELLSSSPSIYAAFRSGPPPCKAGTELSECPASGQNGLWATIFGVWVNGADTSSNSEHRINSVNCLLTYGNVTVVQNGTSPPTLDRSSFYAAENAAPGEWGGANWTTYPIFQLNRIYTELGNSPYDWITRAVGTGSNTAYSNSMAFFLLGDDANNDADTVARQIEANFDMATLHAFARGHNSSDIVVVSTTSVPVYIYHSLLLFILPVPLVATLAGTWRRWQVGGEDVTIGYDPVGIARLGPVIGMTSTAAPEDKRARKAEDGRHVWRWQQEVFGPEGTRSLVNTFKTCDG